MMLETLFGIPIIVSPYLEPEDTIVYQYLHPIIGGHIWVKAQIQEYPIYLVQPNKLRFVDNQQYILIHPSDYGSIGKIQVQQRINLGL